MYVYIYIYIILYIYICIFIIIVIIIIYYCDCYSYYYHIYIRIYNAFFSSKQQALVVEWGWSARFCEPLVIHSWAPAILSHFQSWIIVNTAGVLVSWSLKPHTSQANMGPCSLIALSTFPQIRACARLTGIEFHINTNHCKIVRLQDMCEVPGNQRFSPTTSANGVFSPE